MKILFLNYHLRSFKIFINLISNLNFLKLEFVELDLFDIRSYNKYEILKRKLF
jgi:hypothetical protein